MIRPASAAMATLGVDEDQIKFELFTAAKKAGLEIPCCCAGGKCFTCHCRIIKGAATMDENLFLETWEIEASFTLACRLRPTTNKLVPGFDAQWQFGDRLPVQPSPGKVNCPRSCVQRRSSA